MKCANAQISFAFGGMLLAFTAFIGLAAAPAFAQAPIAAPSQNLKEVAPLSVPQTAPLATADTTTDDIEMPASPTMGAVDALKPTAMPGESMAAKPAPANPLATDSKAIPTAVTDVVGDLKRAEKNVTLEDVARAQDALARLDLLLDIEKKINEIEKVRDERKSIGKSMARDSSASGGFGQIPASALSLPLAGGSPNSPFRPTTPTVTTPAKPVVTVPTTPRASADGYAVEQITGSNGRYRAVISDAGGGSSA